MASTSLFRHLFDFVLSCHLSCVRIMSGAMRNTGDGLNIAVINGKDIKNNTVIITEKVTIPYNSRLLNYRIQILNCSISALPCLCIAILEVICEAWFKILG